MPTLEVFFDYACPYCLRGHENLSALLPKHPEIEVSWRPCEAHPRPERYGPHSDLCARGMYLMQEKGADLSEYHRLMYHAALTDRLDIEDPQIIAKLVDGLTDSTQFHAALTAGAYLDELAQNNHLAWETYSFPAVPSYRMNGKLLKSIEGIGVEKQKLAAFLDSASPPQ